MSLELTGVHGLLKRHKLFTHKYGLLAYLLLFVFIGGCAGTADTLSLQDFWNEEETADNDTMKFVTGLEIIFPKECSCTVRT